MCWTQVAFLQQDKWTSATCMFAKSGSDWLEAFSTSSKISQTVPLHRSGEVSNNKRKCKLTDWLTDLFMVILKFSFAVLSSLQFFTSLRAKPHDSCGMGPQLRYPLHFVRCLKHDACAQCSHTCVQNYEVLSLNTLNNNYFVGKVYNAAATWKGNL